MKNLLYLLLFTIIGCSGSDDVTDNVDDTNPVYLDSNGITVKAKDWAAIGDAGTINGVLYTIVSRETVLQAIQDRDDITRFCTSRIIDMSGMMALKTDFNQDIGSWDVSNVTYMSYMFHRATDFNQDIGSWDVSNVIDMKYMFGLATDFNQDIGSWNVSNVIDMGHMFSEASSFNQDIGSWDVSDVDDYFGFSDNTPSWTLPKPNF